MDDDMLQFPLTIIPSQSAVVVVLLLLLPFIVIAAT